MTRLFIAINAILFLGFGIHIVTHAAIVFQNMGFGDLGSNALYEVRSNYGGVSLGIGLFCAYAVFKSKLQRPALFVLMIYMGGYALGRILALPFEGVPSGTMMAYGVLEAVVAVLAFALLRSGKSSS